MTINQSKVYFSKNVHYLHYKPELMDDLKLIGDLSKKITAGDVLILKNFISIEKLKEIKKYLTQIGGGSLPNYEPIKIGAPNSHRINRDDERAYVKGCFHQFSFYPWNQDIFDFFKTFKPIFQLKNLLSDLPKEAFLSKESQDGCAARIAFQFYPKGLGFLNKHTDPVDYHQKIVPTMLLSKKGVDFKSGGAYVIDNYDEMHNLDDLMDIGDLIFFNAKIVHGVEKIDPNIGADWLGFEGRWMVLFAINKLSNNHQISSSVDLGR